MDKKVKIPWPTKAVMAQIYEQHLWGGNIYDFYSGFGSHDTAILNQYIHSVSIFLKSFKEPLNVLDLGCGDFNVGKHLLPSVKKYTAVDIVETLIIRNKNIFKNHNLEFLCLDISKDKLPSADCVILRQVLQHLSNFEVMQITKKLVGYKYIILTEHIPNDLFIANKDIISGQGIRLKQNSGINLLSAPFNIVVKNKKILDVKVLDKHKGKIVTMLYTCL